MFEGACEVHGFVLTRSVFWDHLGVHNRIDRHPRIRHGFDARLPRCSLASIWLTHCRALDATENNEPAVEQRIAISALRNDEQRESSFFSSHRGTLPVFVIHYRNRERVELDSRAPVSTCLPHDTTRYRKTIGAWSEFLVSLPEFIPINFRFLTDARHAMAERAKPRL